MCLTTTTSGEAAPTLAFASGEWRLGRQEQQLSAIESEAWRPLQLKRDSDPTSQLVWQMEARPS